MLKNYNQKPKMHWGIKVLIAVAVFIACYFFACFIASLFVDMTYVEILRLTLTFGHVKPAAKPVEPVTPAVVETGRALLRLVA